MNIKADNKHFSIEERKDGVSLIFKDTQPYKVVRLTYEELASFLALLDDFCGKVGASGGSIQPKNNGEEKKRDFAGVA